MKITKNMISKFLKNLNKCSKLHASVLTDSIYAICVQKANEAVDGKRKFVLCVEDLNDWINDFMFVGSLAEIRSFLTNKTIKLF